MLYKTGRILSEGRGCLASDIKAKDEDGKGNPNPNAVVTEHDGIHRTKKNRVGFLCISKFERRPVFISTLLA